MMRKLLVYMLLACYLLSFQQARQLLKIPELVEHYAAHSMRDRQTDVMSFIKMHYWDAPVKDADYQQDMRLPFKSHDYSAAMVSLQAPPRTFEFHLSIDVMPDIAAHHFTYSETYYPSVFLKIWQPPKV